MERTSKKNFIIDVFYALTVLGIVVAVSFVVFKFLLPFVLGVIVAFCVQKPAVKVADKTKLSKGFVAATLSFLLYLAVVLFFGFLIYRIVVSAIGFTDYLPHFFEKTLGKIENLGERYTHIFECVPKEMRVWIKSLVGETAQNIVTKFGAWVTNGVSGLIKKLPLFFVSGIVTLVASFYIAKDFDVLKRFIKSIMGENVTQKTIKIKNILGKSVFKIIKGYLALLGITFIELYLGFLVLNIKKPFTLAVIIALVDLLPVLGTGTVMVPWCFFATLGGNYSLGIGLGILYILTVIVRNFAEPKIIGKQLGVNALFTLIAMFLGLKILGVLGLILFPIIFITTIQYYKAEMQEGLSV